MFEIRGKGKVVKVLGRKETSWGAQWKVVLEVPRTKPDGTETGNKDQLVLVANLSKQTGNEIELLNYLQIGMCITGEEVAFFGHFHAGETKGTQYCYCSVKQCNTIHAVAARSWIAANRRKEAV